MKATKQTDRAGQQRWTRAAQYFEYSKAANPIGSGLISRVPLADFPHRLHEEGPTGVTPFDLSEQLGCAGPATSPALCANFIHIHEGESLETQPDAASEVYYVIRGQGRTHLAEGDISWEEGDFMALPGGSRARHDAETDAAFYWVHDAPLLRYLGVKPSTPRFEPTLYPHEEAVAELEEVARDPKANQRSRVSVLLANEKFDQTRTISHVIWTMFGVLPAGRVQLPHRHESVALDFIIDCQPGCYTLIGKELDDEGNLVNPKRADWEPGSAFVTPPGLWHGHYNESGAPAHLMPIQDAGLHTYLRTLDIKFYHPDHEAFISMKS
jgi:gentisate 1,2-dioxygenase